MNSLTTARFNIVVSNMDSGIQFYTGVLGLTLVNRFGDHYAEVKAGDVVIGIHPTEKPIVHGNAVSIGLGVTAFDEEVKGLQSKGVELHVVKDGWVRLAHFTDPDGNPLFLAESK